MALDIYDNNVMENAAVAMASFLSVLPVTFSQELCVRDVCQCWLKLAEDALLHMKGSRLHLSLPVTDRYAWNCETEGKVDSN